VKEITGGRIAVTGGAGFIGSHLVDRLLAAGNEVTVIDDLSSGSRDNLAHHGPDARLKLVVASVLDPGALEEALRGIDYVFHLATRSVRLGLRQPSQVHEVNTAGTYNVLRAAAARRARRLLYCSSSEVYGTAVEVPMREEYDFRPETIYGASKLAGEYTAQAFHRSGWLETVVARPHNTYGPREHYAHERGEVIPRFVVRALAGLPPLIFGDGAQTRDFTYVEETAQCLAALMAEPRAAGRTFNVCRGEEVSIGRIAALISELTGVKAAPVMLPPRPSDVLRLCGDPARLRELLGAAPVIGIREGLERTVAWFRQNVPLTDAVLASLEPQNWTGVAAEPWLER
jgi:UDP-glucose 4-epimerase